MPTIGEEGLIDRLILELMDGKTSLGDIARRLPAEFPQRFANEKEALTRVGELSLKYGRRPESKYLKDA